MKISELSPRQKLRIRVTLADKASQLKRHASTLRELGDRDRAVQHQELAAEYHALAQLFK